MEKSFETSAALYHQNTMPGLTWNADGVFRHPTARSNSFLRMCLTQLREGPLNLVVALTGRPAAAQNHNLRLDVSAIPVNWAILRYIIQSKVFVDCNFRRFS